MTPLDELKGKESKIMVHPETSEGAVVDAQDRAPTKATPGPWTWTVEDSCMAILHRDQVDGGCEDSILVMTICRNCGNRHKGEGWEWGRCYSPEIGNAHLIAAAPELLTALRAILEETDKEVGELDGPLMLARAAVAKAETGPLMAPLEGVHDVKEPGSANT